MRGGGRGNETAALRHLRAKPTAVESDEFLMLRSERRVVITGLGLVSPLGIGPDAYWAALSEGRGAVQKLTAFPVENLPNEVGGEVPDFNPKTWPKSTPCPTLSTARALTKSLKYMARDIQLAVAAAELAFVDAGLTDATIDPTRVGVDLGAGLISTELDELAPAINHASQNGGAFDYGIWGRESIGQIPRSGS